MKNALLGNQSPVTRLVFSILLIISSFLVTFLIGLLLAGPLFGVDLFSSLEILTDYSNPQAISLLKYLQIVQSIGLFIIPPLLAGFFFERNTLKYLRIDKPSRPIIYLFTIAIMFAALPIVNWMVAVNEGMKLPQFLEGMENWMKSTEEEAARLTEAFMNVKTTGGFLVNLLMIAVLPAIGEEFLFRGLLQRLFAEWTKNIHIAIFLGALLFGAMHMQFYGIFPRMMLGVLFGYLFYWTGSIWIPVFAHFINNASAVIVAFLANRGAISSGYEDFGSTNNIFLIIGSALITGMILLIIYRIEKYGKITSPPGPLS
ncbi:MAG: CPBP family intramembrane glutamic endopeptidase [bacterium]